MEEGWTCFEKIFAWAQISHCFTSFYFTFQQHSVNQRVLVRSYAELFLLHFHALCFAFCLGKPSLSFFSSHSHSLLKITHNYHTGQFRNFFFFPLTSLSPSLLSHYSGQEALFLPLPYFFIPGQLCYILWCSHHIVLWLAFYRSVLPPSSSWKDCCWSWSFNTLAT